MIGDAAGHSTAISCDTRCKWAYLMYVLRRPWMLTLSTPIMVSRHVLELCTSPTTLTSELAKEPNQPISKVAKKLFKNHGVVFKQGNTSLAEDESDELGMVARCGRFPQRPSDLFLQVLLSAFYRAFCNSLNRFIVMSCMHWTPIHSPA